MSSDLRPRKTIVLHLADDAERLEELRGEFERAVESDLLKKVGNARVADADLDTSVADAAAAYDEFLTEANERAAKVPLAGLGRRAWRDMVQAHPARVETVTLSDGTSREEKNPEDEKWGFDVDGMADDLVPASLVEHSQKDPAFLDGLTFGQWEHLYLEARGLNTGMGIDPKVHLRARLSSSGIGRTTGATSRSPETLD